MNQQYHLPVGLIIMDGFGLTDPGSGNAISLANTPHLDEIFSHSENFTTLNASEEAVGLPMGQMGNSEVGHLNIGAGRIVYQELTRINKACADGSLKRNQVLIDAFNQAKESDRALHFMGLISDGGVHSSLNHLLALIEAALSLGVKTICIHCFMDGRDVSPTSGIGFIDELEKQCDDFMQTFSGSDVRIASISGRYYAMDRDKRFDRVQRAYEAMVCALPLFENEEEERLEDTESLAHTYVELNYKSDITDEFIEPAAFMERGIKEGDSVIFFNFRPDRAREMSHAITDKDFDGFERLIAPEVHFVCLCEYDCTIEAPVAFPKEFPEDVLAEVLSKAGLRQFHIAETEKYAHVTFFLNGGKEEPVPGEKRVLIPSPKVATYDLKPEMSEPEVTEALVNAILNDESDVYIVNFANCDMVGHTGVIPAAVKAVEAVDEGVGKVLSAFKQKGACVFITADHGNADKMLDEKGKPFTAHTLAPVPFAMVNYSDQALTLNTTSECFTLCNIAPTLLQTIGIRQPEAMNASSMLL